jgi:di/tricarboxylate transporter
MEQYIVFVTILVSLFLFIDGRIRYDFVSLLALLAIALAGIVSPQEAFSGFGHPAVITVVAVLIISSGLIKTGAVEQLVEILNRNVKNKTLKLLSLMFMTAVLSSFMNNVGALALVMPIAISISKEHKISPSLLLMPVAFASLLGGLVTEIGTPPNLIISMYRANAGYEPFSFFDFAPVGIGLTILGILFTGLIGWKLIPLRKSYHKSDDIFKLEDYISEVHVTDSCLFIGKSLKEVVQTHKLEFNVLSIIRNKKKIIAPMATERILFNDIIVIKADHNELAKIIDKTGLKLKNTKHNTAATKRIVEDDDSVVMIEMVLRNDSILIGKTAVETSLRNTYNVNLVAISRKGTPSIYRLKDYRFKAGDILLIQAPKKNLTEMYSELRAIPLAKRDVALTTVNKSKNRILAISLFGSAILLTSLGLVSVQISFVTVAVLMILFGIITAKEFYAAIEWPVIVMLGALLPLGEAMQSTGGADTLANILIMISSRFSPQVMLSLLMILTMALTNLINNAAAAVLMAPIALSLAYKMGISVDPMLMGVCVASSSAFLTPIGHQSNTLVMGPGGYHFGDYWRLGLPISIMVVTVGTPLILLFWPM